MIKKMDKALDAFMRFLMACFMFLLIVFGFWQIFSRWILRDPSTFTDEFLRYALIWASMIGSAYCFYKDKHLALDLVRNRVIGKAAWLLSGFIELCIVGFVVYVFIYGGGRLAAGCTNASAVMHISFKVLYGVLPVSGVMIVLARVLKYLTYFAEKQEGRNK